MTLSSWSLFATALVTFAAPRPDPVAPPESEVRAVSLVSAPGKAELVVSLRGTYSVKDFTLADPARHGSESSSTGPDRRSRAGARPRRWSTSHWPERQVRCAA